MADSMTRRRRQTVPSAQEEPGMKVGVSAPYQLAPAVSVRPDFDRKKIGGNREAVVRAFELYERVFPAMSEVIYASLYTAVFPPLFMKKTERAVDFSTGIICTCCRRSFWS